MKIKHASDYRKLRAAAYPPITELADALVHQHMGNPQPLQDYVARCEAVKKRIPKPSQGSQPPQGTLPDQASPKTK